MLLLLLLGCALKNLRASSPNWCETSGAREVEKAIQLASEFPRPIESHQTGELTDAPMDCPGGLPVIEGWKG
jgi:hypothetical protein